MNILGRIALVIAILACAGALFFANKLGGIRDGLQADKTQLTADKERLTKDLNATTAQLASTRQDLAKTRDDLVASDASLQATKVSLSQKAQEADTLRQERDDKITQLDQVKSELASVNEALKKIQEITFSDDFKNIGQIKERLTAQADENKILGQQLLLMRNENGTLKTKIEELSVTPVNLRGEVSAVQPNWGFVVLNLGRANRVQTNTNFLVYRDTKLVGKVQVRSVAQNTSVAEVLPEFQRNPLRVGDLVVH